MDTFKDKCMEKDTVDSFCGCVGKSKAADPAAKAFCDNAKGNPSITGEDLADLKMALTDDESCCECDC